MKYSDQWEVSEKIPQDDYTHQYEVMAYEQKRTVQRIGSVADYFAFGTVVFRDCTDPMQNAICDESKITAWRIQGGEA